jgi:DNA-binding NarL/FixJ family response regulator
MQYSIVIADDHLLIAKALTSIIDSFSQYEVLYEVEHGQALIEKFKQRKNIPDIVLLDINMPIMDGFETAKWLKQNYPEILILALSMQDDEQVLIKMIKNGANGYLLKNVHPAELEKALDTLVTKGFYYPDWATNKMLHNIAVAEPDKKSGVISARETEFLQYAATELTYKEISEKMFCSPRTVESYRDSLFEKLNLKTRVGLVVYAMKNKIIKL